MGRDWVKDSVLWDQIYVFSFMKYEEKSKISSNIVSAESDSLNVHPL